MVQGATRHSLQGATGCYNEVQEHKPCRVPQGATGCHKDLVYKLLQDAPCRVRSPWWHYLLTKVLGFVEIETLLIQHGLK